MFCDEALTRAQLREPTLFPGLDVRQIAERRELEDGVRGLYRLPARGVDLRVELTL